MTNINNMWMQNFNNLMMKNMDIFNMTITNIIIILSIFLTILLSFMFKNKKSLMMCKESDELELFWTIIPALIIFIISSPSLFLLYTYEENKFPLMDLKIFGNQWYWSYEYPNHMKFDSYISTSYFMRCMNTNNSLVIPTNMNIRLMISSNDVIHSWTIPSLMSKMDAIPGRLNMVNICVLKTIFMKGQCSEICGINHSFMPISMLSINNF